MKKLTKKRNILLILVLIFAITFLVLAICFPFVDIDEKSLYIFHIFNPSNVPFSGDIDNFYAFPLLALTFVSLISIFYLIFKNDNRLRVYVTATMVTVVISFIFSISNYFKVIYPEGFLKSGDVSILLSGFYSFVSFLIFYFVLIIYNTDLIRKHYFEYVEEIRETNQVIIRQYRLNLVLFILLLVTAFVLISFLFVPFIRNYQNYMPESGFEHILDKRTSVDFFILGCFNRNYNYSFNSFLLIFFTVVSLIVLIYSKSRRYLIWIIILTALNFGLYIEAIVTGIINMSLIDTTNSVALEVDEVTIVLLVINFAAQLTIIIISSYLFIKTHKDGLPDATHTN